MLAQNHSTLLTWRSTTVLLTPPPQPYYVYTLHFHEPLPHGKQAPTRHYTGLASDLDARLARHTAGNGSRLMSIVSERGIPWQLAALHRCENYSQAHQLEKRLKQHSATRRCPICRGKPVDELVYARQGHRRLAPVAGKRRPLNTCSSVRFIRREVSR